MATGSNKLAECSQHDGHWGLGIAMDNPDRHNGQLWGNNLLGKVLMELRQEFQDKLQIDHSQQLPIIPLLQQPQQQPESLEMIHQ